MNIIDVMEQLEWGHKVRRKVWDVTSYIRRKGGLVIDESMLTFNFNYNEMKCIDWELYEADEEKISDLTFGEAIEHLKRGKRITRACWHNETIYLHYQAASGTQLEEIRVRTVIGFFAPWHANHSELLANDWRVIAEDA